MEPSNTRVVVQGFGNVGGMAAKLMARSGFKIVCIIEYDGAVYNPHGTRYRRADEAPQRDRIHHRIFGSRGHRSRIRRCFWIATCCCPPRRRTSSPPPTRDRIKAKIICEGANGPTTSEADAILAEKKIFVIPDILANAGGVTVSYFEWVQDRQGLFLERTAGERPSGRDHGEQLSTTWLATPTSIR